MSISQPPFQSTLVDANDRVQTPWAQWFSQLQPLLNSVVASGPTSGRPTQNLFIGYPYFDTTLGQMVYWNGAIWVTYAPSTTGTSILKGNGTGGFNNAIVGTDFAPATSGTAILFGNNAGGFNSVAIGSGVTFAGGVLSASGSGGTVTSVSGTAPIASSGGTTPAISISQAGISTNGYLSSTDWNTFNNKGSVSSVAGTGSVNGITLTGTVTSSGSLTLGGTLGGIANSQLTNSSITINGNLVSLGGSTTVTATATNALTIGTGLSGTSYNGSTAVTIANTGVLSITGTALQITASGSTGAVTLSLPSSINVNTTGYAAGLAGGGANYVPYQTAVNTTGFVSPGVVGQVFTSTGSGSAPNWQNATSPPGSPGYYGAWHDTTTVTATSTTTAYVMAIGSIDLENGTSIVGGTKITVANTGVYNLQFSAQLSNPNSQIANVTIWIRLNGVNVTDGAGTNGVPAKHGANDGLQIISWNYVLNLTAGDYIELVWHSDTAGVQLITFPATTSPAAPESPSLIVTIQAVTQIGIGYQGLTSATSVLIATGSQVFTTNFTNSQTAFAIGTRVRVAYSSTPADFMEGVVTAFSGTTFTVLVDSIGGSGTFASWTISVAGIQGSNGVTSITGTANQVIASASTGAVTLSLPQSINSGAAPTFLGTNFTGIPNAGLTNSTITINGTSTSLGGSISVGTVTGVTGTAPVVSSGGTAPAISMAAATTSVNGYLTSTDWTTFNSKYSIGGALGTPSSGTVTNLTGTASININGTVGATTATTGAFTTLTSTLGATIQGATIGKGFGAIGNNTALGASVLSSASLTGNNNLGVGALTLVANTSGAGNTGVGIAALNSNTTGANNTALGLSALSRNLTANSNTAVGQNSQIYGVLGAQNTSVGLGTLQSASTYAATLAAPVGGTLYTNGTYTNVQLIYSSGSTAVAYPTVTIVVSGGAVTSVTLTTFGIAFKDITTVMTCPAASIGGTGSGFTVQIATLASANSNQCFGAFSGYGITTGSYNTILGAYQGSAAPISATGSFFVVLSDGNGTVKTYYDASGNQVNYGLNATSAAAPTIASATTIAPTKAITFISGVTPIATITAPSPISLGGGTITLIPTGIFTTTIAGNIALASTAVVGRALTMTYDVTTTKWYPSY
jgi:hypothetical protein